MVEVFKTNVSHIVVADELSSELSTQLPNSRISFDLEDCDKILRIESTVVHPAIVLNTLRKRGFACEVLE
jgi:hypothetical protein